MKTKNLSDVIVTPNCKIRGIIETINRNGVRGVFVCDDDGELLGIVMDADIRCAILRDFDLNASVKTVMKTTPFVISRDEPLEKQRQLLVESGKILAPVIDEMRYVVDFIYLPDILCEQSNAQCPDELEEESRVLPPQKILVVGGAGYIGSMLVDKLLRMGYNVRVLDLLLYGKDSIKNITVENYEFVRGDCRDQKTIREVLDGIDAVVHLGEIVGDPACRINKTFTIDINYAATQMIVESCIKLGIKRFVFASSCSVYGQTNEEVDEESNLNPISLYARCKIESEKAILSFSYNHFCPTILRLATVHGKSYRQRFDLVVNLLAIKALTERKIQIFGGEQWRPFVSVEDVCYGIAAILRGESRKVRNQIFNLGDSRENYQLSHIGKIIKDLIPEVEVESLLHDEDERNYRVSFEKIKQQIGFSAEYKVRDSVKDFVSAYRSEKLFRDYRDPKYYNVLALKEAE